MCTAISWFVPLKTFPNTYNGHPLCCAALGAQKNYNSLYLMAAYGNPKQAALLRDGFAQHGLKLNMGKSWRALTVLDDLPLDVIGAVIEEHAAADADRRPRSGARQEKATDALKRLKREPRLQLSHRLISSG